MEIFLFIGGVYNYYGKNDYYIKNPVVYWLGMKAPHQKNPDQKWKNYFTESNGCSALFCSTRDNKISKIKRMNIFSLLAVLLLNSSVKDN
jgi:hypothetical protein